MKLLAKPTRPFGIVTWIHPGLAEIKVKGQDLRFHIGNRGPVDQVRNIRTGHHKDQCGRVHRRRNIDPMVGCPEGHYE